jgi:hypothetical protein
MILTGGFGFGMTRLIGAAVGPATEASKAARQKYPVVIPAATRTEIRNASDETRTGRSIRCRPDSIQHLPHTGSYAECARSPVATRFFPSSFAR